MRRLTIGVVGMVAAAACGMPLASPPTRLGELATNDPRHAVVGRWRVQFTRGDSLTEGTLELSDSIGVPFNQALRGRVAVDFVPLSNNKRPSCLVGGPGSITVEWGPDSLRLHFVFDRHVTHCSVSAETRWYGDSAIGHWGSPDQTLAAGRFGMWRIAP